MKNPKKTITFYLIGICLWGILLYSNTLKAPFVFDDEKFIQTNRAIQSLQSHTLWNNVEYRKRFISFFSFALNYYFHGFDVVGYHVVNLTIHLLTALCVVWLVLLLFQTPRMRDGPCSQHRQTIALLCGWLFLSHPIQTESVTYISQRFECLAAVFYLSALCCYLKARIIAGPVLKKAGIFFISAAAAILGMFTKETVFTLPASVFLSEAVFWGISVGAHAKEKGTAKLKESWLLLGTIFLISIFVFFSFKLPNIFTLHDDLGITGRTYLLTQFRVIMKYLSLLFFPFRQNIDYDFPLSPGWFDGPTLLSLFCLLVLLFSGFKLIRRHPLAGFGILWFFLTLAPTSSILPIRDVMFEHRLYLPSVGFVLVVTAGLFSLLKNPRIGAAFLCGMILIFSFLTYQRNNVWTSAVRLWEDTVKKSPAKARPYANLAHVYRAEKDYQKAAANYLKALKLKMPENNDRAQILVNLGAVFGDLGEYEKAASCFVQALNINPNIPVARQNLIYAYVFLGDYEKAFAEASIYKKISVRSSVILRTRINDLGLFCLTGGQYAEAVKIAELVLKLDPNNQRAQNILQKAREFLTATDSLLGKPAANGRNGAEGI
ncbi:MAG TPA: tetratricopeptide repeat protein [Candidatus Omnitrophota bacterium]|nr:tetratricopeptide repeat protein [Candidatus Omnitrophota bacterium]